MRKPPFPEAFTYCLDETVPDLAPILSRHSVDVGAFATWFAPFLGEFRRAELRRRVDPGDDRRDAIEPGESRRAERRKGMPSVTEELEAVRALRDAAKAMAELTAAHAIPPDAWALMMERSDVAGWPIHEIRDAVWSGCVRLNVLAEHILPRLERFQRRGRPRTVLSRDILAARVYGQLRQSGLPAAAAHDATRDLLVACGVDYGVAKNLDALSDIERGIRRGRKFLRDAGN